MPRYFFHLEDGTCVRDEEGEECDGDRAAGALGLVVAHDLGRNNPLAKEWIVVVTDDTGRVVTRIPCVMRGERGA